MKTSSELMAEVTFATVTNSGHLNFSTVLVISSHLWEFVTDFLLNGPLAHEVRL